MNQTIRWGFVGASGWVRSHFADAVVSAGHEVGGAFGSSTSSSEVFADNFGCRAFSDIEALFADPDIDAIWVASPTDSHALHALAAARAGKAVLVEKPLTLGVEEGNNLARQMLETGRLAGVGYQHRFNPSVLALRQLLREDTIGTVCSAILHHSFSGPLQPSGWRMDPARSGGWSMPDIGSHLLDISRMLFGTLELSSARLSSPGRGLQVDDLSCLMLEYGAATVIVRASTSMEGAGTYIEVSGTKGVLRLQDFWRGGGTLIDSSGRRSTFSACNPHALQAAAFASAYAGGQWEGATLLDGLWGVEILEQARREQMAN